MDRELTRYTSIATNPGESTMLELGHSEAQTAEAQGLKFSGEGRVEGEGGE